MATRLLTRERILHYVTRAAIRGTKEVTWNELTDQLLAVVDEAQASFIEEIEKLNANKIVEGHPVLEFVVGWPYTQRHPR